MDPFAGCTIHAPFAALSAPRVDRAKRHALLDIVAIALGAVVCGADTWVDVEEFGRSKEAWLRTFLALPNGVPSHDTFGRVVAALAPRAFAGCFLAWVQTLATATGGEVVAVDGKTLRRSHDRANGKAALHLVGAWAASNRLVLGQVAVDDKSNEIVAIPALPAALALEDGVVTIDAMGCQQAIARQIREQDADDVLALKDNQPTLHELVIHHVAPVGAAAPRPPGHDVAEAVEKGHGRLEVRRCWATDDPAPIAWLDPAGDWADLRSVALVEAERRGEGAASVERRSALSRLPAAAARIGAAARGQWGSEHRVHWVLDVAFREDEGRVRTGHAAENLAVLRHLARNLLRRETTAKVGIKARRLKAGWDDAYRLKVLAG